MKKKTMKVFSFHEKRFFATSFIEINGSFLNVFYETLKIDR